MNEFRVGQIVAAKGTKAQGFLEIDGTGVRMPTTIVHGDRPGKTVAITGGTHGGEYPGVETAVRLAKHLEPSEVSGAIIIVHPVNVPAFFAKTQYVSPLDGKNLNRMFPGVATGTVSERMAYTISEEVFAKADFCMDLHGGDIHEALVPFVLYAAKAAPEVAASSKAAASYLGVKYVVGSSSVTGTFGSAAERGVPGFLCEIGQCGLWSEADVEKYIWGVKNVLRHLGVLDGAPAGPTDAVFLSEMTGVNSEHTGCWYPFCEPGEHVEAGEKTGEVRDFFGTVLGEYHAPKSGVVLYVISSLAINRGEPIYAIG